MGFAVFFGVDNHLRNCSSLHQFSPEYLNYLFLCTVTGLMRKGVNEEDLAASFRNADLLLRRGADPNLVYRVETYSTDLWDFEMSLGALFFRQWIYAINAHPHPCRPHKTCQGGRVKLEYPAACLAQCTAAIEPLGSFGAIINSSILVEKGAIQARGAFSFIFEESPLSYLQRMWAELDKWEVSRCF